MEQIEPAGDDLAPRPVRWWQALLAGVVYAGLMTLAFPPFSLYGLVFLAPLPLFLIVWRSERPFRHALLVLLGSAPFYAYQVLYVIEISAAGYPPLVLYLSAWPALFVWLGGAIHRRLPDIAASILLPLVWVGFEVLRGEVIFGGFEWYYIAQAVVHSMWLASPAALGGVYLVSLLVVIPVAAVSDMASKAPMRRLAGRVAILLAVIVWIASALTLQKIPEDGDSLRIALVQTNVPQDNKTRWTLEQREQHFMAFVRQTREAAAEEPDLIVWPETMFPGMALDKASARTLSSEGLGSMNVFREALISVQASLEIPMLVGASRVQDLAVVDDGRDIRFDYEGAFNSAFVIDNGRVQDVFYDKLSPTPFGETLPYIKNWPWLQDLVLRIGLGASGMDFGLDSGTDPSPLVIDTDAGQVRAATPICFESTQSRICRRIVTHGSGADLMIIMTNDGWFKDHDAGRRMHQLLARWRCLELGVPAARCANTGISSFIDRRGRVVAELEPRRDGTLTGALLLGETPTVFRAIGNLVGWAALGATGVLMVIALAAGRRGSRQHASQAPAAKNTVSKEDD